MYKLDSNTFLHLDAMDGHANKEDDPTQQMDENRQLIGFHQPGDVIREEGTGPVAFPHHGNQQ